MRRLSALVVVAAIAAGAARSAPDEEQPARDAIAAKRFAEAREIYRGLLIKTPANMDYAVWVGRISGWLEDFAAAHQAYDQALARQPRNVEALLGKATIYMYQRRFNEALPLVNSAAELAPRSPEPQIAMARFHHYLGEEVLARKHALVALEFEPDNAEAQTLLAGIEVPQRFEMRTGFAQDRFSFTGAGNMGYVTAGYVGDRTRFTLHYEAWDRFTDRVHRGGASVSRKLGSAWSVRAGALEGPGASALPRHDYTAGVSVAARKRLLLGFDYRYLNFSPASVHVASPMAEYYFKKPVWVQLAFHQSWTIYRQSRLPRQPNQSYGFQYFHQVAKPVLLKAGYAYGNESVQGFSVDQLGKFLAHNVSVGADLKASKALTIAVSYTRQRRSGGATVDSIGAGIVVRR